MMYRLHRLRDATWVACAASILAGGAYLSTLMWNINGSDSVYADDVGEYQVALPLWGTVHPTGTPLYMLIGSPFVALLNRAGVSPAAGASLFSLVWATGAIALTGIILLRLTRHTSISVLTALIIGLTPSIWIHGSIAEVYSLWLFLVLLTLLISLDLQCRWSDNIGWILAFVTGLGVAHHRLFGPLIPVIVIWLWKHWPRGRRLWRWGSIAVLCFALGFLPYIDMVQRARSMIAWVYGDPGTWDGFWALFWASEYSGLQRPLLTVPEYLAALSRTWGVMTNELGWPGFIVVAASAPFALQSSTRKFALLFLTLGTVYLTFAIVFAKANFFEMAAMPTVLGLFVTGAMGVHNLVRRYAGIQHLVAPGLLLVAGVFFWSNRPEILQISRDADGLATVAQLDDLNAPMPATIMSPWGRHHFALAYTIHVEKRFPGWSLVHHAADLSSVIESEEIIFTNADTIYGFGADWWAKTIGSRPYFNSAGPGWISISRQPVQMTTEHVTHVPLDEIFLLKGWSFEHSAVAFEVTLCWQATSSDATDYSTFTHLSKTRLVTEPGQLVASSDHAVPVDGWHPTSSWLLDEIVCDAHKIALSHEHEFSFVSAGMYTRSEDGGFDILGSIGWELEDGKWLLSSWNVN